MSQMTNSQWVFPSDFLFTCPSSTSTVFAFSSAPNDINPGSQLAPPPSASNVASRTVVASPVTTATSPTALRRSKRKHNDVAESKEISDAVTSPRGKKTRTKTLCFEEYTCVFCPERGSFPNITLWKRHQGTKKCRAAKAPDLECPEPDCNRTYPSARDETLTRHLVRGHGYKPEDANAKKNEVVSASPARISAGYAAGASHQFHTASSTASSSLLISGYSPNELASITPGPRTNVNINGFSRSGQGLDTAHAVIYEPHFPGPVPQSSVYAQGLSNSGPSSFMVQYEMQQESSLAQYFGPSDLNNLFSFDDNTSFGTLPSVPPMSISPLSSGSFSRTDTPAFLGPSNNMATGESSATGFYSAGQDYQGHGFSYGTAPANDALYSEQAWNGLLATSFGHGFDEVPFTLHTGAAEGDNDFFHELLRLSSL